jgi:hypothetical protein
MRGEGEEDEKRFEGGQPDRVIERGVNGRERSPVPQGEKVHEYVAEQKRPEGNDPRQGKDAAHERLVRGNRKAGQGGVVRILPHDAAA